MRVRAQALESPTPGDLLPWRQRMGHDPTWLMLREGERVAVLTSFLAALWDGSVEVSAGTGEDPQQILVYQEDRTAGAPMVLDLRPTSGGVSRWVDVVCAYERYVLAADQQGLARCKALIARKEPGNHSTPSGLYEKLLGIAETETAKARQMHEQMRRERIESGLTGTLAAPLEAQFWELLQRATEVNRRQSYRWRIDPATDLTSNGALPAPTAAE
jgi:hypothetical protein